MILRFVHAFIVANYKEVDFFPYCIIRPLFIVPVNHVKSDFCNDVILEKRPYDL